MTDPLTLRWAEVERYDVATDREVIRMQAITSRGTWYADFSFEVTDQRRGLAAKRKAFKERVLEVIAEGGEAGEIDMEVTA